MQQTRSENDPILSSMKCDGFEAIFRDDGGMMLMVFAVICSRRRSLNRAES